MRKIKRLKEDLAFWWGNYSLVAALGLLIFLMERAERRRNTGKE